MNTTTVSRFRTTRTQWGSQVAVCISCLVALAPHRLLASRQPASAAEVQQFLKLYEYDKSAPLNAVAGEKVDKGFFTVEGLRFSSVNNQSVTGYLYEPKNLAKAVPCILFLHGYSGSKNDSYLLAQTLTPMGYVILALDAQYHGDRKQQGKDIFSPDLKSDREAMIQTIVDWRRGIDYLETRQEIDSKRIGLIGASLGGILGGVLSGVDERIKAAVLIVAGGDWATLITKSQLPQAAQLRPILQQTDPEAISKLLDPVDPLNFIGLVSPRPLLMQNGKRDSIVSPICSQSLFDAAGQPKEIDWYDSDHSVPPAQVAPRVMTWIKKTL